MKQVLLYWLAAVALLTPLCSTAQTFRPGFIVQAAGDTTKGLVRYREGRQNYKSCIFKTAEDADTKEYLPADILAYGIAGEAPFMSKEVPAIDGTLNRMFIEVLEQGKLMLYTQDNLLYLEKENSGLKHLYLQTDDQDITRHIGEQKTVNTSTQHLILLNSLTLDCPVPDKLMLKVQKRLLVSDVTAIVRSYNTCVAPANNVSYKKTWLKAEVGMFAGSYSTAIQFNHKSSEPTKLDMSHNLVYGAILNFTSPKRSERISVQVEPTYSKERHSSTFRHPKESYVTYGNYNINMTRLSIPVFLRYKLTLDKRINPYVGFGIANDYILNSRVRGNQNTEYHYNGHIEAGTFNSEIGTKFSHALTAAVGSRFQLSERQDLLLQFRYEFGRYIADTRGNPMDNRIFMSNKQTGMYLTAAFVIK
ncbi:outer membrane beta-barrel protein [Pontibacter lucknowensis]|uniref:Outer membrane protein beta-barrel domain-containing protein n=1 Tax=Pontibacter lucknowensis TaxID=1077936 RepID=A0A1N6UEF8_9BACT|nr:outer membrane beta-barrel protein [Pontibacter lucknowensis]SIQ63963.1 Outer membrane protein beta-barrel domain-containing protein [Pontibacter lucknowensis]